MKLHFLVRAWLHVWHPGYRNLPPTEGCKGRHESLFWMRMMLDIYKAVHQCEICALTKFLMAPLIEISVMFYWWSLSSNLCKWKRRKKNIFQDALPWNNSEQSRWHFHLVFLWLTLILFPCPLPFCLYVVYLFSQATGWWCTGDVFLVSVAVGSIMEICSDKQNSHGTAVSVEEDCSQTDTRAEPSRVMLLFYLWPLKYKSSSSFLARE